MQIFRQSGLPLNVQDLQAFETEFKKRYDELLAVHGLDMQEMHKALELLDVELKQKWKLLDQENLPKSNRGWKQLCEKYQAPVMVAMSQDNPKTCVLMICDNFRN
jgi:hypothetical protein